MYCDFLAGVFAGACNIFISHPFDTIKTNMQSDNMKFTKATMVVFKAEGIKGFYRGLMFPLCCNGLLNSIIFGVYGNSFRFIQALTPNHEARQKYWFHHVFLAGCCGGIPKAIVACPIELTKVRLQVRVHNATGPLMVIRHIMQTEGSAGLFRGLSAMLWRDALPYGLFMLVYEYTLERLREPDSNAGNSSDLNFRPRNINPMHTAIAGALAGMASWVPAIPFDVVKTRMMTERDPKRFRSVWQCLTVVKRESGYKSLFRGGSILILRSAPTSAVSFMGYEYMLRYCQSLKLPAVL